MHNSPKFSYRKTRKNRILTAMRLATYRRQANKVLLDKGKYQFSRTIVAWQVTRNRQISVAVGNYLVEKKPLTGPQIYSLKLVHAESFDQLTSQIVQITVQPKNNACTRSGARSSCAARTRKRQKIVKLRF